jgi:hypothetical protein
MPDVWPASGLCQFDSSRNHWVAPGTEERPLLLLPTAVSLLNSLPSVGFENGRSVGRSVLHPRARRSGARQTQAPCLAGLTNSPLRNPLPFDCVGPAMEEKAEYKVVSRPVKIGPDGCFETERFEQVIASLLQQDWKAQGGAVVSDGMIYQTLTRILR